MMTGTITDGRPQINLLIKGTTAQALAEFTIDTGYSGTLTLPLADCITTAFAHVSVPEMPLTLPTIPPLWPCGDAIQDTLPPLAHMPPSISVETPNRLHPS